MTQRGRAAAVMLSVAALLRLLVRGAHESAVGMGDDLVEVLAEAQTFLGQAPGTTSDPAEPGHAGDGLRIGSGESAQFPTGVKEALTLLGKLMTRGKAALHRIFEGRRDRRHSSGDPH